jgi:hypothetical protein
MVKMVVVEVRDPDGTLVRRVTTNEELFKLAQSLVRGSEYDLLTLWIFRILRGILTPAITRQWISDTFTDTTGTVRTQNFKGDFGGRPAFWETYACPNRLWISYGSSSVPPSRTDYRLGSKLGEAVASMTHDEGARTLTFTAGWTLTADTTVYEVGLEWEACVAGFNVCGRVLLDRTVYPDGIPVRAGQTLTIAYVFSVP